MQRRMPERESAARRPPHSKNPQDYLKPILPKEPDRVKGIRAGERVRTLEDIQLRAARGTWLAFVRTSPSSTRYNGIGETRMPELGVGVPDMGETGRRYAENRMPTLREANHVAYVRPRV